MSNNLEEARNCVRTMINHSNPEVVELGKSLSVLPDGELVAAIMAEAYAFAQELAEAEAADEDAAQKALAILKSLLPPTDYIVPVTVRKKIQEAYDLLSQSTHE